MVMRIAAGAVLAIIGLLLIVFGVGLLAYALAAALVPALGLAGGAAVAGAIFVLPPFLWAIIALLIRRTPPKPVSPLQSGLGLTLFGLVAREVPWIAILGAGAIAAGEMFLTRRKRK